MHCVSLCHSWKALLSVYVCVCVGEKTIKVGIEHFWKKYAFGIT